MLSFEEYADEAELDGIKHVGRKRNSKVRRIIWGIIFLGSFGVLIYITGLGVITYFAFGHVTSYDVNYISNLDFPAVTFCNANKYRLSSLTLTDIAVMGPHIGLTDSNLTLKYKKYYPEDWYNRTFLNQDWETILSSIKKEEYNLTDFQDRSGHQLEDLVQHCIWQSELCNESSWTMQFTSIGKCYTFNLKGDHVLRKAGSENGLKLVLYAEEEEYLRTQKSQDHGVFFLPHYPPEPPLVHELGHALAPGFHYYISLQRKEVTALPDPYGLCLEEHQTKYYSNYTVSGCRIECETETILEKCGCKLLESPGDHPLCTVDQFDCVETALEVIENTDLCTCQVPCHFVKFTSQISMLSIRADTIDILKEEHPIQPHLTEKELITLNIYYDSLSTEYIEQSPGYTLLDVISDFGGNMGLFVGASLLSIVFIIDAITTNLISLCTRKKGTNSTIIKVSP